MKTSRRLPRLRRLLAEPLVQFAIGGALLFAAASTRAPGPAGPDGADGADGGSIVVTTAEMADIAARWRAAHGAAPTPANMRAEAAERMTPEILYREALRLGFDRDDPVIRRRLVDKARLYIESLAAAATPDPAALNAYFESNRDRFALSERFALRRLPFSGALRGTAGAREAAQTAAAMLRDQPETAGEDADLADPDAWPARMEASRDALREAFGEGFVTALAALPTGSWRGPVADARGWQVVWVERHDSAAARDFAAAESDVRAAYAEASLARERARVLDEVRARYRLVLPKRGAAP